jgi:hypothetical protein
MRFGSARLFTFIPSVRPHRMWCHREASGEVYVGGVVDNTRHGAGVRTRADGSVWTVTHHQGTMTSESAKVCGCDHVPHNTRCCAADEG